MVEQGAFRDVLSLAAREVVYYGDLVAAGEKVVRDVGPYKAGTTGQEDSHIRRYVRSLIGSFPRRAQCAVRHAAGRTTRWCARDPLQQKRAAPSLGPGGLGRCRDSAAWAPGRKARGQRR